MKTRIIQNEPEPEPSVETEAAAPVADEREAWLRRACFLMANAASAADGAVVQRLMDTGTDYVGVVLFVTSDLSWFVMALAAAIAVKPIGGRGPTLLMAIGAAIFAIAHPFPPGPIGITLFGLGIAWLEVRREAARAPEAPPVLAP